MSQLPPVVSYTQISTFQRCKWKYWLKYFAGLSPTTKGVGLIRGIMLHQAVDAFYTAGGEDAAVGVRVIGQEAQKAINAGMDATIVSNTELEALSTYNHYMERAVPLDDFQVMIARGASGMEITEHIDLKLRDGTYKKMVFKLDGMILRSGRRLVFEMKYQKDLDISYLPNDLQSTLYIAAWNAVHPEALVEGVFYSVTNPKPNKKDQFLVRQETSRTPEESKIALRNAASVVEEMQIAEREKLFPMHVTRTCSWDCDLYALCYGVRQGAQVSSYVDSGQYVQSERSRLKIKETSNG